MFPCNIFFTLSILIKKVLVNQLYSISPSSFHHVYINNGDELTLHTGVLVGFERTAYANNETGGDMVQVNIVREDSLISVHDFTVRVLLSPHSTATG